MLLAATLLGPVVGVTLDPDRSICKPSKVFPLAVMVVMARLFIVALVSSNETPLPVLVLPVIPWNCELFIDSLFSSRWTPSPLFTDAELLLNRKLLAVAPTRALSLIFRRIPSPPLLPLPTLFDIEPPLAIVSRVASTITPPSELAFALKLLTLNAVAGVIPARLRGPVTGSGSTA